MELEKAFTKYWILPNMGKLIWEFTIFNTNFENAFLLVCYFYKPMSSI